MAGKRQGKLLMSDFALMHYIQWNEVDGVKFRMDASRWLPTNKAFHRGGRLQEPCPCIYIRFRIHSATTSIRCDKRYRAL